MIPRAAVETPEESARRATFRAICKGLSAWQVAKACNRLTPGLDWRGSTKGSICEEFMREGISKVLHTISGQALRDAVAKELAS